MPRIDSHPVDREKVRSEWGRATLETLLAKRQFPVGKHQSNVRIEQRELLSGRLVGAGRENRIQVYRLNNLTRRERQGRDARSSLRFAANIGEPATPGRSCRKAVYGAPTLPIGASEIIELRLGECVAGGERRTRDMLRTRVE